MDWPLEEIPYLSYTKINMFRRCPEQFRRRYLLDERQRPAWALLAGDADHKAIAYDLENRIDQGPGVAADEVLDFASEHMLAEIEENGGPQEYDWGPLSNDITSPGDYKLLATKQRSEVLKGVSLYHSAVCPTIYPRAVELEWDMQIPQLEVPVKGYVDVQLENGVGVERKTTNRNESQLPGNWRIQGLVYALAMDEPMRWDITVRTAVPQVHPAKFTLAANKVHRQTTLALIRNAADQILHLYETRGPYTPWPDAIDHMWACKKCGWGPFTGNDSCSWWAR
jgi:hypothetical protein